MKTKNVCLKVLLCALCLVFAVSCLFACDNEQVNSLTDKADGLQNDVNDLKTLVDTIKATAENAATSAALTEAVSKSDASFADLKAQLTALAAKDAELAAAIAAAATKEELEAAVEEFNAKVDAEIAALKAAYDGEIEAIKNQLEALDADTVFASEFLAATDELWNGEYSIANFDAMMAEVLEENYPAEVYDAFYAEYEELRHFLTRAITVDAIKGYFAALEDYIDNMPDLAESISTFVEETEKVVLLDADNARGASVKDADDIESLLVLVNKYDGEFEDELAAKLQAIIGAYNALVDAKANNGNVVALIEAIDYVIYDASKTDIKDARDAFDAFAAEYFSDADYAEYYDDDVAESVVDNYDVLVDAEDRYAQLTDALGDKIAVGAIALEFNADRPLFNEFAALQEKMDAFNAWCEKYEIDVEEDAESINTIYYENNVNEYTLLKSAYAYAKAMNDIYTNIYVGVVDAEALSVETLIANIKGYTDVAPLYTDAAAVDALKANVVDLKNAIADVENYDAALDGNYAAMGMVAVEEALDDLIAAIDLFEEAKVLIDEIVEDMNNHYDEGIGYTDGDIIIGYEEDLDAIAEGYEIGTEGANYDALLADAYVLQDKLFDKYAELVQTLKELYDEVTAAIAAEWELKDGGNVAHFAGELRKFVVDLGIVTIDIPLDNTDDDHATQEINLKDLYDAFLDKATEYKQTAKAAEAAAAEVAALVAEIPANYKDLKSTEAINAAYNALVDWIEAYLVDNFDASANYAANFEEIVGIAIYGEDDVYVFVSVADYEKAVEAYIENTAAFEDAAADWAEIKADMDALIATNGNNIHFWNNEINDTPVNFVEVAADWADYIETYYSDVVDATTCVHNEFETYDDFLVAYAVCEEKYDWAVDDATDIIAAINALDKVVYANGVSNGAEVLVDVEAIEALIETYEATYCEDDCLFGDSMVKLAQVKATAEFALECEATYDAAVAAGKVDKLATIWDNTAEDIASATNEGDVAKYLSVGESKLTLI